MESCELSKGPSGPAGTSNPGNSGTSNEESQSSAAVAQRIDSQSSAEEPKPISFREKLDYAERVFQSIPDDNGDEMSYLKPPTYEDRIRKYRRGQLMFRLEEITEQIEGHLQPHYKNRNITEEEYEKVLTVVRKKVISQEIHGMESPHIGYLVDAFVDLYKNIRHQKSRLQQHLSNRGTPEREDSVPSRAGENVAAGHHQLDTHIKY